VAYTLGHSKGATVDSNDRGGEVIKGTLDMMLLHLLNGGAMHGWEITERLEQRSKQLLAVNQGSLYPALYRLVARGWLSSEWRTTGNNRRARYYALTAKGRAQLVVERAQWERLSRGVNLVLRNA
jgi:PadR family transcriptional regulator